MKTMFEIIAASLISIGGGGAIVFALASWLGKVWANKILEKEKSKYAIEIEEYKTKLNIQLANINTINEKAIFVTKIQYEKEFAIYLELWEDLCECVQYSIELYPGLEDVPIDEKDREEFNKKKYSKFVDCYNKYLKTINKFAPFYNQDFYAILDDIRINCAKIGSIFKTYKFDVKYSQTFAYARDTVMTTEEQNNVYTILPKKIKEEKEELRKSINRYLRSLQTGEI